MSSGIEFRYQWLGERSNDPELAAVAGLSILVGGFCVTEVEDRLAQTTRNSIYASALQLAEWLVGNWWRLMWETGGDGFEWEMAHRMSAAGGGYVWPDISFISDWNTLQVVARADEAGAEEPIVYLRDLTRYVALPDFERALDDFVNATLIRVAGLGERADALYSLWAELQIERNDLALRGRRRLEACLGFDPDDAPARLVDGLLAAASTYGTEAVCQLAALGRVDALSYLQSVNDALEDRGLAVMVPGYDHLRGLAVERWTSVEAPWQRGVAVAQLAREYWDLGVSPLLSDRLADMFGVQLGDDDPGGGVLPLSAGLRESSAGGRFTVALNRRRSTGRRFALARLVADDLLASGEERLLAATEVRTARQQFQRAFAQELLCPFDGLRELLGDAAPDADGIEDAAAYFDVSPLTVGLTLVHNGVLDRELLADW